MLDILYTSLILRYARSMFVLAFWVLVCKVRDGSYNVGAVAGLLALNHDRSVTKCHNCYYKHVITSNLNLLHRTYLFHKLCRQLNIH